MRITIAVDSFKGSLKSLEAGNAIQSGIAKVYPNAEIKIFPIADGGEGTVEALLHDKGGILQNIQVTGPILEKINAVYGILPENKTAVIEIASAAGLTLVPKEKQNPFYTTTYGVGEIIKDAISKGCRSFIVGLGGSATNDGGVGMLQALGYSFLNKYGKDIPFGAIGLRELKKINNYNVLPELRDCKFTIACDVRNPLCGKDGCSFAFANQKGATDSEIIEMDKWLSDYAEITQNYFRNANPEVTGTGAAGGLGFAFLSFTNAVLKSGINIILEKTNMETYIMNSDLIITGEGRLDSQTVMGKVPFGIAKIAKKYNKPVIAFAGSASKDANICNKNGIDAFFPILRQVVTLDEAMNKQNALKNLTDTAEQVMRLFLLKL